MKKIGLIFIVILFFLVGCSSKSNEEETYYTVTIVDEVFKDNNKKISVLPNAVISDELKGLKKPTTAYRFIGYFYYSAGTEKVFGLDTPITGDITIYLKWEANVEYTVQIIDTIFPQHNKTIKVMEGKQIPARELILEGDSSYEFICWLDEKSNIFNPQTAIITQSIKLYPHWKKRSIKEVLNDYIAILLDSTQSYIPSWNREGFKGRWNYIDGVFLNSVVSLYETTKDMKYRDFLITYIDYYIDKDGDFIHPETKEKNGFRYGELDSICASKILFDAYQYTEDERYAAAIEKTYQALQAIPKASGTDNFWHKESYPNQLWLDGMYMYVPFYARYALWKNKPEIFHQIKEQYRYMRENMFDEEKKLYYHGHDTTKTIFWANKETGNSESFWLRSMGWYMVSLVDVLSYFPDGEDKEYLKSLFKEAIEGVLTYQDQNTKMFFQLVDLGSQSVDVPTSYLKALHNTAYPTDSDYVKIDNYVESSGSSMIAYCLLEGNRKGYLNQEKLLKGKEIFEGIYNHSFKNSSLNDICITAGLGPETNPIRDGSPAYYLAEPVGKDDAKGIGPFIMAYLAYIREM